MEVYSPWSTSKRNLFQHTHPFWLGLAYGHRGLWTGHQWGMGGPGSSDPEGRGRKSIVSRCVNWAVQDVGCMSI